MAATEGRPLFVFGTLRRGRSNHHLLVGTYDKMLPAKLVGYQRILPLMIRRKAGHAVTGELYFIRPEVYAETLQKCDLLEGIPPCKTAGWEYKRVCVPVRTAIGTVRAWAYVHPQTIVRDD
ncbi:MAG: gamma-glutamylcyclotransferase family protein [Planctomycetales bacterium]